jgi:hypothetical protein
MKQLFIINNEYVCEIISSNDIIKCTTYGTKGGCLKAEIINNCASIYEIYAENTNNVLDLIYDDNIETINLIEISLNFIKNHFKNTEFVRFDTVLKTNPALLDSYLLSYYYICFYGKLWLNNINGLTMNCVKYKHIISTLTSSDMMSWKLFSEHILLYENNINCDIIYTCYTDSKTYLDFFQLLKRSVTREELFSTLGGYSCEFVPLSWYNRFMQFLIGSIVVPEFCDTLIMYSTNIQDCGIVINNYNGELNRTISGYKIL